MALGDLVADGTVRVLSGTEFDEPVHASRPPPSSATAGPRPAPLLVLVSGDEVNALKSFRNLPDTRVLAIGDVEVQDYVWAKQPAVHRSRRVLPRGWRERRRRRPDGRPADHHPSDHLREELPGHRAATGTPSRCNYRATKPHVRAAVEEIFKVQGHRRATP